MKLILELLGNTDGFAQGDERRLVAFLEIQKVDRLRNRVHAHIRACKFEPYEQGTNLFEEESV